MEKIKSRLIGYSRDHKGKVMNYHLKDICGTIHTLTCGGGNTATWVWEQYKKQRNMNASKEQIINELNNLAEDEYVRIRKFTPREVLRLMGVRDDRIDVMLSCGVSNSQIYKQAGNSIVVDNLIAIFDTLFYPNGESAQPKPGEQLSFW